MARSFKPISEDELQRRLRKALAAGRADFDETIAQARRGEVQIHAVPGAVAVTNLSVSGPFRTCYVLAAAGQLEAFPALEAVVEKFARTHGAQAIEMGGREGWAKRYDRVSSGYKPIARVYRKILES